MIIPRVPAEYEHHGMTGTPEHHAWISMKLRCYNVKDKNYSSYGGRGICVYKEWQRSFNAFIKDVGMRPSNKHSLDRINVDGNYVPGNVRWATRSQQNKNIRKLQLYEVDKFKIVFNSISSVWGIYMKYGDNEKYIGSCDNLKRAKSIARSYLHLLV